MEIVNGSQVNDLIRWLVEGEEMRKRGRLRKRWMDCIREVGPEVDMELATDRARWRAVTR